MLPPSHRYVRLRFLQEVSEEALMEEVQTLRLPGYWSNMAHLILGQLKVEPSAVERGEMRGLRVAYDRDKGGRQRKAGRRKRETPLHWLEEDGHSKTPEAVKKNFGLSQYLDRAGPSKVQAALWLWSHPVARPLLCTYLLRDVSYRDTVKDLKKLVPEVAKRKIRPIDVEAFQHLLWDFGPLSHEERVDFLKMAPGFGYVLTGVTQGLDVLLFRMGLQTFDIDRTKMLRQAQRLAFMKMDEARVTDLADARSTVTWYNMMRSAMAEEDRHTSDSDAVERELYATAIKETNAAPIPTYSALLEDIETRQIEDSFALAVERELITEAYRAEVLQRLRSGASLDDDQEALAILQELRENEAVLDEDDEEDFLPLAKEKS